MADRAVVYPAVELSGERVQYIPEILYLYVELTELTEGHTRTSNKDDLDTVMKKPKEQRLDCLFEESIGEEGNCPEAREYIKEEAQEG